MQRMTPKGQATKKTNKISNPMSLITTHMFSSKSSLVLALKDQGLYFEYGMK